MAQRKTPPTKLLIPELADCSNCNGAGWFKGTFHQMVCDPCDGNGEVNAKDGERVSKEVMVFVLRQRNIKLELQLGHQKQNCTCKGKEKGHFDDFKTVHGGRLRLD